MAVDEYASVWPGCRPARALISWFLIKEVRIEPIPAYCHKGQCSINDFVSKEGRFCGYLKGINEPAEKAKGAAKVENKKLLQRTMVVVNRSFAAFCR